MIDGSFSMMSVRVQLQVIAEHRNMLIMSMMRNNIPSATASHRSHSGCTLPSSCSVCTTANAETTVCNSRIYDNCASPRTLAHTRARFAKTEIPSITIFNCSNGGLFDFSARARVVRFKGKTFRKRERRVRPGDRELRIDTRFSLGRRLNHVADDIGTNREESFTSSPRNHRARRFT